MASRSPIVSETLYPIRARTSKTPVDVIPSGDAQSASQRGITTLHATSVHPSAEIPRSGNPSLPRDDTLFLCARDVSSRAQRGITTLHATSVHPSAAAPGAMRFGEAGSFLLNQPDARSVQCGFFSRIKDTRLSRRQALI